MQSVTANVLTIQLEKDYNYKNTHIFVMMLINSIYCNVKMLFRVLEVFLKVKTIIVGSMFKFWSIYFDHLNFET